MVLQPLVLSWPQIELVCHLAPQRSLDETCYCLLWLEAIAPVVVVGVFLLSSTFSPPSPTGWPGVRRPPFSSLEIIRKADFTFPAYISLANALALPACCLLRSRVILVCIERPSCKRLWISPAVQSASILSRHWLWFLALISERVYEVAVKASPTRPLWRHTPG